MKALASTGLVRVEFKRDHRGYREGDRADFSPPEAQALVDLQAAALAPVPKGAATVTIETEAPPASAPKPKPHTGIPDDWQSLHKLQQMKIAEQITGAPVKQEDAAKIITDELARRSAE